MQKSNWIKYIDLSKQFNEEKNFCYQKLKNYCHQENMSYPTRLKSSKTNLLLSKYEILCQCKFWD